MDQVNFIKNKSEIGKNNCAFIYRDTKIKN